MGEGEGRGGKVCTDLPEKETTQRYNKTLISHGV